MTIHFAFPDRLARLTMTAVLSLFLFATLARTGAQTPGLDVRLVSATPVLSITGALNCRYSVQYSTDLTPPCNWQALTNLVLATNPCLVADVDRLQARRFYRVLLTNSVLTLANAQVQDMCSRMCDTLALTNKIPETIMIGGGNTNTVTAAEFHYVMVKWLQYYRNSSNPPPAMVAVAQGTRPPGAPAGLESGTIYLADILTASQQDANFIDVNGSLPDYSSVGALQYSSKAMLWLYARTINWYQDHSATMPTYATVKAVGAPDSWPTVAPPNAIRVAVFTDPDGGSTDSGCFNATVSILSTNAGFNVSGITGAEVRAGMLTNFDVVMFPGGSGTGQATALQQAGCAKVEQFVARGGGFVGTCAGAYLPARGYNTQTSWLEIVDVQVIDVEHWNRGTGSAQVHLVHTANVILSGFPEYLYARYVNGPLLGVGNSPTIPDCEADAVFVSDIHDNAPAGIMPGTVCMTTSVYEFGRCVLFSFHPELTPGLEQMDVRAVRWAAGKL